MKSHFFFVLILIATILLGDRLMAQNSTKPCEFPESGQFDFWLGEWNLTWSGPNDEKQHGTNTITKILGGCAIEENFNGSPDIPLIGKSISMYSPQKKAWTQLWVDNQGGYLDFIDQYVGGSMVLSRETVLNGQKILQRIVWYNISANALDWNWEKSVDNGNTWELSWKIHYERKMQ